MLHIRNNISKKKKKIVVTYYIPKNSKHSVRHSLFIFKFIKILLLLLL